MNNNPEYVPPEGAIGYDFFNNFTIVVDRGGKKMGTTANCRKRRSIDLRFLRYEGLTAVA